ncbi:MAG: hypothetical protein ABWY50_06330 [Aeromicrobium sp.]
MTADRALRAYLRLAERRVAIDSPAMRLATLARAALGAAGARVVESVEAGVPVTSRSVALSWTQQHDLLLRELLPHDSAAVPPAIVAVGGRGVVLSDDGSTVARSVPADLLVGPAVLWAAPTSCLLDPPATPPAALTLTAADARRLGDLGVRATSLLAWPSTRDGLIEPSRVVVAVAADACDQVGAVVDAVAATLAGRPVIDLVTDGPLVLDGVRHAPHHPWIRTRLARSADLVLVLGRSASADLVAAEAVLAGATCVRVTPEPGAMPPLRSLETLESALPDGLRLGPIDPAADAGALHLPLTALAGWLVEVAGSTPVPQGEEG